MDNHIDPKVTEILRQLDSMKDSVIIVGRSAADVNRVSHTTIEALRCELEAAKGCNAAFRRNIKMADRVSDASTISMIVGWLLAAICFTGWMLS